ncbi:MAG: ABC transporter ATP-binding protein [Acidimicrobiia bacterium]
MSLISFSEVSKFFGDLVAVSEVTFTIDAGVTALLGPNGAGKSTILRMMCGLTPPSSGEVQLLGRDPRHSTEVMRDIGLVPQQDGLFEHQSAFEFVRLAAILHHLPNPEAAAREALARVELSSDDTRPVSTFSKGMRQRVKIAQALVHHPPIIILDEPLTGLDPRQRLAMVHLFNSLGQAGYCVVVSSHVLDEVERFGSRILVIAEGRLAAIGDFHAIRDLMDDRPHRLRIVTNKPRELGGVLLGAGQAMSVRIEGPEELLVDTNDIINFRTNIARAALQVEARVEELASLDDNLESVFRYLVER